ncbi:MAG: hypothetical protein AAB462_03830 [Patescibacteria group bacterium]
MNEVVAPENAISPEQSQIANLTKLAIGILDEHKAVFAISEDGTQTREITTPIHGECSLTETITPEGVRGFEYKRPVLVIELGNALKTTEWKEGSSIVDITLETEENGTRKGSTSDPTEIRYHTHLYLSSNFPLPEEPEQPKKDSSKLMSILSRFRLVQL